ncbi:MAG TPA: Fic family protein [Bryobacteraceae bacterium]|nr:Fic family protein [Bryobacteraceae bacterium]
MTWNWQKPDWRAFYWDAARLAIAEERFLRDSGVLLGMVRHLSCEDRDRITVEAISREALTTSEIEGEVLDRASVQSSVKKQLGMAVDKGRVKPGEQGIAEMMVHLFRNFADPLGEQTLFDWHTMLMLGRRDLRDVGRYRTDPEPMQIVSGPLHAPRVHFEAPPAPLVPGEMEAFLRWFHGTGPDGASRLPAVTRAGIAHLWFVSIHPFEDGNGRIGRAVAEKALAQSLGQPTLIALAESILAKRKAYYDALETANKSNEVTNWLEWFVSIVLDAQLRTIARVDFIINKTRLLDRLRGQLNLRQEKALVRVLQEGPDGFKGGLSASNYASITGASPATVTRDLGDLVAKGAFERIGERRHARYFVRMN